MGVGGGAYIKTEHSLIGAIKLRNTFRERTLSTVSNSEFLLALLLLNLYSELFILFYFF